MFSTHTMLLKDSALQMVAAMDVRGCAAHLNVVCAPACRCCRSSSAMAPPMPRSCLVALTRLAGLWMCVIDVACGILLLLLTSMRHAVTAQSCTGADLNWCAICPCIAPCQVSLRMPCACCMLQSHQLCCSIGSLARPGDSRRIGGSANLALQGAGGQGPCLHQEANLSE